MKSEKNYKKEKMIEIDDCIPCWPFLVHRFFITEHKTINDDISKRLYEISKEEEGKIYSNYKGYHSNDLKHENCMKPLTEAAIPMALGKIISDFQIFGSQKSALISVRGGAPTPCRHLAHTSARHLPVTPPRPKYTGNLTGLLRLEKTATWYHGHRLSWI